MTERGVNPVARQKSEEKPGQLCKRFGKGKVTLQVLQKAVHERGCLLLSRKMKNNSMHVCMHDVKEDNFKHISGHDIKGNNSCCTSGL